MSLIDRIDHFRLLGPEHRSPPGAYRDLGQGGPPGPSPYNGDAVDLLSGAQKIESFIECSEGSVYLTIMDEKTATRDRILHAASARMMHYGYCKTTMAEVAADCGMSPGNIYRFFEAKIDIGEEMARKHFAARLGDLAAIVRRKDSPPDVRLRELFLWRARDSFRLVKANAKVLELVDVLERDRPMFLAQAFAQERVLVASLIEEGVQAGLFRPCDVEFTAEMIQITMIKFGQPHLLVQSTLPKLERELNGVMDLMLRGLYIPA